MRALLTLAAAAAVALAAFALQPAAPEAVTTAARETPSAAPRPIHEAPRPAHAPDRRALRTVYALDWQQTVRLGDSAPITFGIEGEWLSTPRADGGREFALRRASLLGELPIDPADLEVPLRLEADAAGTLARIGFVEAPPTFAHRILVGIAAGARFSAGKGRAWTAVEADRTGRFEARYLRPSARSVVRTRGAYLALHGPDGALHSRGIDELAVEGETRFDFDDLGLSRVELAERFTSKAEDNRPRAVVDSRLVLIRIDHRPVALEAGPAMRFGPLQAQRRDMGAAFDRQQVGEATVAELIGALRGATPEGLRGADRAALLKGMSTLAAALRLDPRRAMAVAAAARAADDKATAGLLTGALGAAGTRESVRALAELFANDVDPTTRKMAMVNMARSDYADAESVAAVQDQLDDEALGRGAELALGAQAQRLAESDPEAAAEAVGGLFDQYAAAESTAEKQSLLLAMANSGDPRLLDVAREGLGDPLLAADAAYALRFVPGEAADALLGQVLAGPGTPALYQSAVKAIGMRDIDGWRGTLSAALDQPHYDADTRALIERVLARNPG